MIKIHPTAIIEPGAEIGPDCVIEAYAYIGGEVRLGAHCRVRHHATVEGFTEMGPGNDIYPYALVGGQTQDLKFRGGRPGLIVGTGNTIREYATIHTATADGDFTRVGSHNNLLAYTHIAHDCQVGDYAVVSNNGSLAGHVRMGSHVVIGGFAGVHQFCHIGDYAMIGGFSKVVQDVPPYFITDGNPAAVRTINKIGLERAGFNEEAMTLVKKAYRLIYQEGLNRGQSLERLKTDPASAGDVFRTLIAFIETSQRGLT